MVTPYRYDSNGRRVLAPSKGALREKAILDEAERQLTQTGYEAMTVESIANAAGLTRAALYFYFRSKNDVLAALVQRVTVELTEAVSTRKVANPNSPPDALRSALDITHDLWDRHGAVMRAAVSLSASVPAIAELWDAARETITDSVCGIAISGGTPKGPGPLDAYPLVRVLVGMTERAFYDASNRGTSLEEAKATLTAVWFRALRFEEVSN